nr:receptor like protein kinase S.2 [Ipomoea trifida]
MHIKLLCFVFPDDDEPALPALVDHKKDSGDAGDMFLILLRNPCIDSWTRGGLAFAAQKWWGYAVFWQFNDTKRAQMGENKVGSDNPRIFSYYELFVRSNGFSESEILCSGGFGMVYSGWLCPVTEGWWRRSAWRYLRRLSRGAGGRGSYLSPESCQPPGLCSSQSALPSI